VGDNSNGELHPELLFVFVALNEAVEKEKGKQQWQVFYRLLVCFCSISQCGGGGQTRQATTAMASILPAGHLLLH